MFVCLFIRYAFKDHASKRNETFQKPWTYTGEGSDQLFPEKIAPSFAYRRCMKLTNRIAAFEKLKIIDSEGSRRSSEYLSANNHTLCLHTCVVEEHCNDIVFSLTRYIYIYILLNYRDL